MTKRSDQPTIQTLDLREVFYSLLAQWKLILLCILFSICTALLYLRVSDETYAVDAFIRLESQKGASAALLGQELSGLIEGAVGGGNQAAQDEARIIKSRMVLGQTIQQLHLDVIIQSQNDTFWNRIFSPSNFSINYAAQGVTIKENSYEFLIKKLQVPSNYLDQNLLLEFKGSFYTISDIATSQVIYRGELNKTNSNQLGWQVEIIAKRPFIAQFNLTKNSLATAIDNLSENVVAKQSSKLSDIIDLSLEGKNRVLITNTLNSILTNYKAQNVKSSLEKQVQTLSFLEEQLPELKQDLDNAEKAFNIFRQENNTVDVNQEAQLYLQQSIQLEMQQSILKQKQAETLAKYTENHPLVSEINAQISTIDEKINQLNSTLKRLPDVQRRYLQFYRDVEVKNQLYTNLLNTYQTIRVAKEGEIGNVRIIDTAIEPVKPIKPKSFQIIILSIFLGGFAGICISLIRSTLRTGIKDVSMLEQQTDLPVYATIPRSDIQFATNKFIRKKSKLPILAIKNNEDLAIESLRSLRTAIYFALAKNKNQVIQISGATPEAGKSFISVNLATILAQNGKRVLLIDADLRRGYLHKYFEGNNQVGLTEILATSSKDTDQIIKKTTIELLDFIGTGKRPNNPAELFNTGKFESILNEFRSQYDHIIIDTPPILAVTDSIMVSQFVDINLLVVRFSKTQLKEVEITINRFNQSGKVVDGFVLNDVQYTTGYTYTYNYDYKQK